MALNAPPVPVAPAPPPASVSPSPAAEQPRASELPAQLAPLLPPQAEKALVPNSTVLAMAGSPLEQARVLAERVRCGALSVRDSDGGLLITGPAATGREVDDLVASVKGFANASIDVRAVDRSFCSPLEAVASAARRGLDGAAKPLIEVAHPQVVAGARLVIDPQLQTDRLLLVDLYAPGGTVQHLLRQGTRPSGPIEWTAVGPAGPRLLVAIASRQALELPTRLGAEQAAGYVTALNRSLERDRDVVADIVQIIVTPAPTNIAKPTTPIGTTTRSTEAAPARCQRILERAQLGEQMSDADLTALRGECRR